MTDLVDLVTRSLAEDTATEFRRRVETQADALAEAMAAGELDNGQFTLGLELEVYAVERDPGGESPPQLARLPAAVFESPAGKELGLHNAELNTDPDVFSPEGLSAQEEQIRQALDRARAAAREEDRELVLDAMWTLPPEEGSDRYLGSVDRPDDVTVAANVCPDPRYVALDNDVLGFAGGEVPLSVPGVERTFPTFLFESLATSIQPHLQIPDTAAFPDYYNAAIRTLGPVLALATNSPFLPPDLYTDAGNPERLVDRTHHELRIAVFEQSTNHSPNPKVRVPDDIETTGDTLASIVDDDLYAPFLREWTTGEGRDSFADRNWEFDHKRSTHWRWLRCVVGGDPVEGACDERSVRIEYRPIPTQPTVRDIVGMQALTAGLVRGLVAGDHPLVDLPWAAAERAFYSAAREGLDADLAWVTADGERTDDAATIFEEVFEYARLGLAEAGLSSAGCDRYLDPIERRWEHRTTPSVWKKERVRAALADGRSFEESVTAMQREYIERSRTGEAFADWL